MQKALSDLDKQTDRIMEDVLRRSAIQIHALARKYCPISPTMAQKKLARKTRIDTRKRRKPTATTRAKPGGLARSIEWYAGPKYASVFVASNSEGGSYARKIHDERYKTWRKLGIGSRAKGPQAREKFIDRAAEDSQEKIHRIMQSALRKIQL